MGNRLYAARLAPRRPTVPPPPPPPADPWPGTPTAFSTLGLGAAANYTVAADANIAYDLTTPVSGGYGTLTVYGKFCFANQTVLAQFKNIIVKPGGLLQEGKADNTALDSTYTQVIELTGTESGKVNNYCADLGNVGGSGNGVIKKLSDSAETPPTADQTLTITFTSSTAFNVTSNVAPTSVGSGTVGTVFNNRARFVIEAGSVAFANGNTRQIILTRKGSRNASSSRSIVVEPGGRWQGKGAYRLRRTKLQGTEGSPTFAAGTRSFTVADDISSWKVGDKIAIATTEYFQWGNGGSDQAKSEEFEIATINTATKSFTTRSDQPGLLRARYAVLQYVKYDGLDSDGDKLGSMSLTDTGYTPPYATTPRILDERATVINLTSNVRIQGADDSAWADTTNGRFGAHTMVMGNTSYVDLQDIEFYRCGQQGRVGRYPLHSHMPSYNMPDGGSYPSDGVYIGAVEHFEVRNCAFNWSSQHAVQLHGCRGVKVYDCVTYNISGHAFNLEDGSERRNEFKRCVALYTRKINLSASLQLKEHEGDAAGFWITNLDNDVYDCEASEGGFPFWFSPAQRCFGLSRDVAEIPYRTRKGLIQKLVAHSAANDFGIVNSGAITDERGRRSGLSTFWYPTHNDGAVGGTLVESVFEDVTVYKCVAAYFNRIGIPTYKNWITADCKQTHFNGAVNKGQITRSLGIRQSLNVTSSDYTDDGYIPQRFMASYHISLAAFENLIVGFNQNMNSSATYPGTYSAIPPTGLSGRLGIDGGAVSPPIDGQERTSCMVGGDDMYMQIPEHGWYRFYGNELLSTIFAQPSRSWPVRQAMTGEPDFSGYNQKITDVHLDSLGMWGPAGNFVIPDLPYFTYNASASAIKKNSFFKTTAVRWFGIQRVNLTTDANHTEIDARRYDATFTEVGRLQLKRGLSNGTGVIKRSHCFSLGGRFKFTLGSTTVPTTISSWQITLANDVVGPLGLIALPWSGSVPVKVINAAGYTSATTPPGLGTYARQLTAASSLSDLDTNTTERYWQDTANHLVWVKPHANFARPAGEGDGYWDDPQIAQANTLFLVPA